MNNFEQRIEEIDKDTKFRYYTKDLIRRHSDKKHSILPYEIDVRDVYSILKDLNINENEKYVVFFNFEFVAVLKKLGVSLNNIIFISGERKFYGFIRNNFGKFRLKTILFDTKQYQKYKSRKKWKNYIMKKIGKPNDFIGVGNIPFTINSTDSTNSKKIGNDFIKLMNQFKQSCYILPAKFDSKSFKEELIINENLKKIVYHKKSIFDIHEGVKTCHVVTDNTKRYETLEYTDNISSKSISLKKDINLILSREFKESYIVDSTKLTLGSLWTRGNVNLNKISKNGKYKVITSLGSHKEETFNFEYDDMETTSLGKWKVIIPNLGGGRSTKIAGPEYSLSYSVIGFCVDTEEQVKKLYNFIINNDIIKETQKIKTSNANTKTLFDKITLPNGII